jgi:hypothetical protein
MQEDSEMGEVSRVPRIKVQGRVPEEFVIELQRIADEDFNGSATDALSYVLATGLHALMPDREFDPAIDEKPTRDDVAPFRQWLMDEVELKPRQATLVASWVRRAYRSGDPKSYVEDPALDPKIRATRASAWRYWTEYCLVNQVNPKRVHVSRMQDGL